MPITKAQAKQIAKLLLREYEAGYNDDTLAETLRDEIAKIDAAKPDLIREKLLEAVNAWPQFDVTSEPLKPGCIPEDDGHVDGGDMVEWFAIWRAETKALLGKAVRK